MSCHTISTCASVIEDQENLEELEGFGSKVLCLGCAGEGGKWIVPEKINFSPMGYGIIDIAYIYC